MLGVFKRIYYETILFQTLFSVKYGWPCWRIVLSLQCTAEVSILSILTPDSPLLTRQPAVFTTVPITPSSSCELFDSSVHCWRTQPGRSRRLHGSQHGHNGTWRHWPALHKQRSRTGNMRLVLCNTVRMSNWHLVLIQICLKRCDRWRSIAISQAPTIYSTDIRTIIVYYSFFI